MKKTIILFILFLALAVFVYFYEYKGSQEREKVEELKASLLKIERDEIESVTLIRSEEDTITYIREEADNWRIVSPVKTEADKSAVSGNINAFINAKIKRRLETGSGRLKNFGLDPPVAEVVIKSRDSHIIHIHIGDETPIRGDLFVTIFSDLASQQRDSVEILVTAKNVYDQTQKSLFTLRDKKIAHFDDNQVRKMELISPEGEIILEKSSGEWIMAKPSGVPVDGSRVKTFLSSIKNYSVKEFVQEHFVDRKSYGFDEAVVKLILSLGEERAIKEIVIGDKKEDDESFYGYESGRSPLFLVRESTQGSLSKSPFYFQDKKIVKFEGNDITGIRFSGNYRMILTKEDTLGWYAYSDSSVKVEDSQMNRLFSRFRSLNARELVTYKPENLYDYGLSEGALQNIPFLEVVLAKGELEVGGFTIGDTVKNDRYIKSQQFPFVYLISTSQVERLTEWLDEVFNSD